MSSHYIHLACSVPECGTQEMLYTGETYSYDFDDEKWEGETISIPCKLHTKDQ